IYTILLIVTTVWCGGIGFLDDYIKVFKHKKEGLSEKGKLVLQFGLGLFVALTVCISPDIPTDRLITTIPFVKAHEFDYSWLSPFKGQLGVYCSWGIYMVMIILVTLACSNGTNLTDGMDGLASGTSAIVGVTIGVMAWLSGDVLDARYLNIMYIPGAGEVAIFMAAFVGALIGFLWYNTFPAQVFMGDTGSLTIGGIIGVSAVLIRKELILPLLCGIFVVESLSVIIQRTHFKYTKKKYGEGRRVFLMAPIHHHFQKKGIPEPRIVTRFWIIGIILAVSTLAVLKIR
ncbi:MAG: phospho-N-acetylmuramoyl-pentapeptide-transferase, partial [Bacteroidales bacterium]|nr:phospho-N-acetylmuramoyl-pentapeptide-transferase [Bacteroidales bacterium]